MKGLGPDSKCWFDCKLKVGQASTQHAVLPHSCERVLLDIQQSNPRNPLHQVSTLAVACGLESSSKSVWV